MRRQDRKAVGRRVPAQEILHFGRGFEDAADSSVSHLCQDVDVIARTGDGLDDPIFQQYCNAPHTLWTERK